MLQGISTSVNTVRAKSDSRNLLLLAMAMNVLIIGVSLVELIPDKNGMPYDSAIYGDMVRRVERYLLRTKLDSYYIQRLLPSALAGGFARLFQIPVTPAYTVAAFKVLNLAALNAAYVALSRVLRERGISGRTLVTGMLLAFGSFFVLKFALYYPVLTDCTGFAIGAALLHAYRLRKPAWILLLGISGAFTHPLLIYVAGTLFMFPAQPSPATHIRKGTRWPDLLFYAVPVVYALSCLSIYAFAYAEVVDRSLLGTAPINMRLFFPSVAVATAFLFAVARLAVSLQLPDRLAAAFSLNRTLIVLAAMVVLKLLQHWRSAGAGRLDLKIYLYNTVMASVTLPGQFLIAHFSFFGPLVLLVLLFHRRFAAALATLGSGHIAVLIGTLFLSVNSESRQYIIGLPFLILPLTLALREQRIGSRQLLLLSISTVLVSKVWFPINYAAPEVMRRNPALNQRLFMHIGPWMLWESYLLQLGCFAVTGIFLSWLFRRTRPLQL